MEPLNGQIKRILVPFRGLPLSSRCLHPATRIARALSAELILARIECPPNGDDATVDSEGLFPELKGLQAQTEGRAERVTILAAPGSPEEAVAGLVEREGIDLVVLAVNGPSGVPGAVAESILHQVPCATLFVHPKTTG